MTFPLQRLVARRTPAGATRGARRSPVVWIVAWTLAIFCLGDAVRAQESQPAQPALESQPAASQPARDVPGGELTVETIQARMREIEASTDLTDTARLELLGLLRQAREQLELGANWAAKAREFVKAREETPARLAEARARLDNLGQHPTTQSVREASTDLTLQSATQALLDVESELRTRRTRLEELEAQSKSRLERRDAITEQLSAANSRLERSRLELSQPPPPNLSPQIASARRTLADAQRLAAQEEVRALNEETRLYAAQTEALVTFREEARLSVSRAESRVSAWRAITSELRQAETDRQQREAQEALQRAPLAVRELAETVKQMADERSTLAPKIDAVGRETVQLGEQLAELDREQAALLKGVQSAVIADSLSPRMRQAREKLIELSDYERRQRARQEALVAVVTRQTELHDQRFDVSRQEAALLSDTTRSPSEQVLIRETLKSYRETIEGLSKDLGVYEDGLRSLIDAQGGLLSKIDEFRRFIDKHVLWVRSTPPITQWPTFPEVQGYRQAIFGVFRLLAEHLVSYPFAPLGMGLLLLGLFFIHVPLKRKLHALAEQVARARTDSYRLTLSAVLYTVLLAIGLPLLAWFLSVRLTLAVGAADADSFRMAAALSAGLGRMAVSLLALELARAALMRRGLFEIHFRWNGERISAARRNLIWFEPLACVCVFLVTALERHPDAFWNDTLGRTAFLVGLLGSSFFALRILRRPLPSPSRPTPHWLRDIRTLWFLAVVVGPLILSVAAAVGYYYTAMVFSQRLADTVKFVLLLLVVYAMLMRWLFVAQRRLALEQARRKKAAAEAAEASDEASVEAALDEQKIDILAISAQTRKIVTSVTTFALAIGVWFIWVDLVPSLDFIDQVEFWPHVVDVVTPAADPGAAPVVTKAVRYVTLGHVVVSGIAILVTIILARNIPGLLEIAVLQQIELDNGARVAISTLARYLITIVGVIIACSSIGVNWSQLQWLVAAISVGLGFGLQEIVANFVCGLILLFERPIRVGDIVTVGSVEGRVARIRMRATTIMDWDRRELLIPNKDLVTGQVVNWTLTDTVTRVVIHVGVAYGSDAVRAEGLLLKIARESPYVMNDPPPSTIFRRFGTNALEFQLMVFLAAREQFRDLVNELHMTIYREFEKAGIEIALPQMDVRLRSVNGIEIASAGASRAALTPTGEPRS